MRRDAKAWSAGSTSGTGSSRSLFGRAFAVRGASGDVNGSGASSGRWLLPVFALAALALLLFVAPAGATVVHPFKETFGSATQPSFAKPEALTVDQSNQDILVTDAGANEVQKVTVAATAGQFKLTFGAQTTGWTGTGSVTCDGISATITSATTATGVLSKGEQISASSGSCIKPNTTISNISGATITLSQTTENIPANTGTASLVAELPFNVSSTNLKEALEKLSSIGASNVAVAEGPGDATGSKPYVVTFQGALAIKDVEQIAAQNGATPLSGGAGVSVATSMPGVRASIQRFKPNGEPDPFSALGTNVIDARKGAGAKACGEEPSSCDVPASPAAEGLQFEEGKEVQVAVDNSGSPLTNGNIYVTQKSTHLVDIFVSDGHYVGQLTQFRNPKEAQEVKLTGASTGTGADPLPATKFVLGNLPAGCISSSTREITYAKLAPGRTEILAALEEKCGPGAFSAGGNPPNVKLTFEGKFLNMDVAQLTCTVVVSSATCAVQAANPNGLVPTSFSNPYGVAVDAAGSVYVGNSTSSTNLTVSKFTPSANPPVLGDNVTSFLPSVNPGSQIAAGSAGTAGYVFVNAGNNGVSKYNATTGALQYQVSPAQNTTLTVDPSSGRVLTASGSVATEYDASGAGPAQTSTLTALSAIEGIAVNKTTGNVYVARAGQGRLEVFGPPIPSPAAKTNAATAISATRATLNGTVNAEGTTVTECFFEYGKTTAYGSTRPCEGTIPPDSAVHEVSAAISGLEPNGVTYHYRIVAKNAAGPNEPPSADRTFTTAPTAATLPATEVGDATATLNGSVNPVGAALTACKFEYGLTAAYGLSAPCSPAAGSIEADFQLHAVSAAVSALQQNTTYHFRLVTTSAAGTIQGEDLALTTFGRPIVSAERPLAVTKATATLTGLVNPDNRPTTYHFEWGAGATYDHRVPADFEAVAGSGSQAVKVSAALTGLQPDTAYHFHIVAQSSSGTTTGEGAEFRTLNEAGLPDNRGIEMVSPADKRPAGGVEHVLGGQVFYQAAEDGETIGYPLLNGLTDSKAGGEVIFAGERSEDSWGHQEVTPPALIESPIAENLLLPNDSTGHVLYYGPADLGCALVESFNPLTKDTPPADVANGVYNLYRWNRASGDYTLITDQVPLNPTALTATATPYEVIGASKDCSRIFFISSTYSFIAGASPLYEWDSGTLRDAGVLPDHSVSPGYVDKTEKLTRGKYRVSSSGRFFFVATSNQGPDSGKSAIFVRKSSTETVDASQSTTATPSLGARYEAASPDGAHVFFLANYGLTSTSSSGPSGNCAAPTFGVTPEACDLYDYNVETNHLTDISADSNPTDINGAMAQGALAVSEDGSTVYFAARGQLVAGKGRTYQQNIEGGKFANIYRSHAGQLVYVGSITDKEMPDIDFGEFQGSDLIHDPGLWNAQTTKSGSYLLFTSRDNIAGTNPLGAAAAYLYSADTARTECVSCPTDGSPPHPQNLGSTGPPTVIQQQPLWGDSFQGHTPRSLSEDGRVFFTTLEALTPDAVEGQDGGYYETENNIYEWHKGQVALLASGKVKLVDTGGPNGRDVFIRSYEQLSPSDFDFSADIYDFRAGGGFAPPPPPPASCDVAAGECQGAGSAPPGAAAPASAGFSGPGNPPAPAKEAPGKHHKKKHHKKKHAKRAAKTNRGGAK